MVRENTTQAAKGGKQLKILPNCNSYEPLQLPAWQDMNKGARNGSPMLVATKSCLIGFQAHSEGQKPCLVLETSPASQG